MADQPDAFDDKPVEDKATDKTGDPGQQQPSSNDAFEDHLKKIVNEDGQPKYDSVQKALEALDHSQRYIPELKQQLESRDEELARIKAELEKRESVEDVVKRLTKTDGQEQQPQSRETPEVSGLDEQSAKQLFEQMIEDREKTRSYQDNRSKVNQALAGKFGEKTSEVVRKKAEELGTTAKELGDLASRNPQMALALFDSGGSKGPSPTTSSINSASYKPTEEELQPPERSLLAGATSKEQAAYMRKIKEDVYRRYGVTTN